MDQNDFHMLCVQYTSLSSTCAIAQISTAARCLLQECVRLTVLSAQ